MTTSLTELLLILHLSTTTHNAATLSSIAHNATHHARSDQICSTSHRSHNCSLLPSYQSPHLHSHDNKNHSIWDNICMEEHGFGHSPLLFSVPDIIPHFLLPHSHTPLTICKQHPWATIVLQHLYNASKRSTHRQWSCCCGLNLIGLVC